MWASRCCSGNFASSSPFLNSHTTSTKIQRRTVAVGAWKPNDLFEPPPFKASKLNITFTSRADTGFPSLIDSRRYTLTHNDVSGQLWLSVGKEFNWPQISGFYTRLLRDEVVAEWRCSAASGEAPTLHIFCHVSGEERWLAPPALRNYIFRREMPLVLDCVKYAERDLFKLRPELTQAPVYIHFQSSLEHLDSVECWGTLGDRRTWKAVPVSIVKRLLYALLGLALEEEKSDAMSTSRSIQSLLSWMGRGRAGKRPSAFASTPVVAACDVVTSAPPVEARTREASSASSGAQAGHSQSRDSSSTKLEQESLSQGQRECSQQEQETHQASTDPHIRAEVGAAVGEPPRVENGRCGPLLDVGKSLRFHNEATVAAVALHSSCASRSREYERVLGGPARQAL